jgi:exodeoxyribonuclease V alpha subunit
MHGELETIQGEITEARILGGDFWGSAKVRVAGGPMITAVGKLLGVQPGDTVELEGAWAEHPRFGRQFKFRSLSTKVPRDSSGVVAWLSSRLPNLGPKRAAAIVEELGAEGVWRVIEHEPDRLLEVPGITPERRDAIVEAYWKHRAERDRIVRFKTWGLTDGQIARVIEKWGARAEEILAEDPYQLCDEVYGFGFKRADATALRMGLPPDSPARIRAALLHLLAEAAEGHGHAYVPGGALISMAAKLIVVDGTAVARELAQLVERGRVRKSGSRAVLPELDDAERDVAGRVARALGRRAA